MFASGDPRDLPSFPTRRSSDLVRGLTLTCHRAVDAMVEPSNRLEAVTTLLGLGFHRVLTSGGATRALDGAAELAAMVRAGEGLLVVCAGGGVRPVDIADVVQTA